MTIGSTSPARVSFNCDGSTTVFPVPIQAYAPTDLEVILTAPASAGGTETTLVLNSDYSLATSGTLQPTAWTLTTLAGTPYAAGYTLQVFANPAQQQQTQYVQGQAFPSLAVQTNIDRLTQMVQRLQDQINRSARAPDGDVSPGMLLPVAPLRISMYLATDANGNLITTAALPGTANTQASLGPILYPQTQAEINAGIVPTNSIYPAGNVLRYGIVPNNAGSAAANTVAAKALFAYSVANGPTGDFIFPNLTGNDTYYFSDAILFRPGCRLNLNGCTLSFTKVGIAADSQGGFLFATQDFSLRNGSVIGNYPDGGNNTFFSLIQFGARDVPVGGSPLPTIFDSLLPNYIANGVTMGKIRLENVYLNFNNPNANAVTFFGGVNDVAFENVFIECNSQCIYGIYGEFGWATNQANQYQRQTSHPHNHSYKNVHIQNVNTGALGNGGIVFNGGYNILVDGLHVSSAPQACGFGSGESLFFQPWVGVDDIGSITPNGRSITLRNITGRLLTGHGIDINGNSLAAGGYLAGHITGIQDEVDQLSCLIDGFNLDGGASSGGYGIFSSAAAQTVRNGKITNFQRGIVTQADCTLYAIEGVTVLDCSSFGMELSNGTSNYGSPRQSNGSVRACFIAGSGFPSTATAAIILQYCNSCLIEACRFGYEAAHDNQAEASQSNAVNVSTSAFGVVCRANDVAACASGVAYAATGAATNSIIDNPLGNVTTSSGTWSIRAPNAGWGTPTGGALTNNFPGATATLIQTSEQLAYLITQLKAWGILAP